MQYEELSSQIEPTNNVNSRLIYFTCFRTHACTKGEEGDDDVDDEGAVEGPVGKLPNPSGRIMSTWFLQDVNWKLPKLNVMITLDTIQVRSDGEFLRV
jgi:hypothetical protein